MALLRNYSQTFAEAKPCCGEPKRGNDRQTSYLIPRAAEPGLTVIEERCKQLEIKSAIDRITRIRAELKNPIECTYVSARIQFRTLYETIEDDLKNRKFYYLPKEKEAFLEASQDIPLPPTTDRDDLKCA